MDGIFIFYGELHSNEEYFFAPKIIYLVRFKKRKKTQKSKLSNTKYICFRELHFYICFDSATF